MVSKDKAIRRKKMLKTELGGLKAGAKNVKVKLPL